MKRYGKEAAFREVMAEVTLVDLGSQSKAIFGSMGCLLVFFVIVGGADVATSSYTSSFRIPDIVWHSLLIVIFILLPASDASWHEWKIAFYFPKVGFWSGLALLAYILAIVEPLVWAKAIPDPIIKYGVLIAVNVFLIIPGSVMLGLMELGHRRLMEKRQAETSAQH